MLTALLYVVIPKGFFPVQDTGVIQGISEAAAVGLLRGDGRAPAGAGAPRSSRTPTSRACPPSSASTAPTSTLNSGRFLINLKPRDERAATRERRHPPPAAASAANVAGITPLHAAGAGPDDRHDGQPRRSTSSCSRTPNPTSSTTWVPKLRRAPAAAAAARGRRQRPAGAAGLSAYVDDRPRHRRALRHHAGDRRQRALRRLRPAHRLDDLHPVEPVPGHPRGRSRLAPDRWSRSARSTCPPRRRRRARCRCSAIAQVSEQRGAAADQPSRPVPGDHRLVQPRARRLARRRRSRRSRQARARDRPAGEHPHRASRARRSPSRRRSATSCC